jgi:hypothetical protein
MDALSPDAWKLARARGGPWRRLAREPLFHFLLLGLLLFAAFDLFGGERGAKSHRITVDDAVQADLVGRFTEAWQRPPDRAEVNRLIADYVKEEILYRQGMAMGLGEDDPVVRRRIRQKVEVMSEESQDAAPPTDAQLEAYLRRHAGKYRQPPLLSFDQLFFDPAKRGVGGKISAARARLHSGADFRTLGDVSLLPDHLDAATPDEIADDFGGAFAGAVAAQPLGRWVGPIRSGLGEHLVRITAREGSAPPRLDEVRTAVRRDWEDERRRRNAESYYEMVRKDYDVIVTADPDKARDAAR